MKFVTLDVKTANSDPSSICEIGIGIFENEILVATHIEYIDPETLFDPFYTEKIHGISEEWLKYWFSIDLCVTIGCIPVTDYNIKEIYLYAIQARQNGQLKIPVYIFPFIMTSKKMKEQKAMYIRNEGLLRFWDNLKEGHDKFEVDKRELNIAVDGYGNYLF